MKRSFVLMLTMILLLTACAGGEVEDTSVPTFDTAPTQPTQTPTQPTEAPTTAPAGEGELIFEGVAYDHLDDVMEALSAQGRFEQESYSVTIEGLSTPVTLYMSHSAMTGYAAWDYSFDVDPTDIYGNVSVSLREYQGIPILNIWYDCGGTSIVMLEEGPWSPTPSKNSCLMVFVDEEGALRCLEESTKFIPSVEHWDTAPIDLAVSRDELYDAWGTCTIDGDSVQPVMTKVRTISDVFDLDEIFADAKAAGKYPQFDTVDQLLQWNLADHYQPEEPDEYTLWDREERREDGTLQSKVTYFGDRPVTVQIYDEQGRLTVRGDYDNSGRTKDWRYSYDDAGNCIDYAYFAWGEEVFRYTMAYDAQGRVTWRSRTRSGATTGVQDFTYAADGSWTETFSQNGQEKYTCHYDADGKLIRHFTYEDGVAVETKDVGALVKAQQVMEVRIPALDNSPLEYSFRYDGVDLIYSSAFYGTREETSYDGSIHRPLDSSVLPEHEDVQQKVVYSYADGLLTEKKTYEEGELLLSYVYTWDGDTQTEHCLDPQGIVVSVLSRTYEDGRMTSYEEGGGYRAEYVYSDDGRSVDVHIYMDDEAVDTNTWHYDEAGRRIAGHGWDYTYEDGALESIFLHGDDYILGTVMIDYYEVWVGPEKAQDLTDTFNEALDWLA